MGRLTETKLRNFRNRGMGVGDVSLYMYGETHEFALLGEEFHEMAKARVAALRESRPHDYNWHSIGSNYAAVPVVYTYRHAFELYLKGILIAAEPALTFAHCEPGINASVFSGGHSFAKLFPEIERAFSRLNVPFDFGIEGVKSKKDFCGLLEDLDHLQVRFPIDTKRKPAMGDTFVRFNLFEFAERMDVILETLNGFMSWIDDKAQGRCEMAQEAREAAWENGDYDREYEPAEYYGD